MAERKTDQARYKTTNKRSTTTKRKPAGKRRTKKQEQKMRYELKLVALATFVLASILSMHTTSMGAVGAWMQSVYFGTFGKTAFVVPYFVLVIVFLAINPNMKKVRNRYMGAAGLVLFAIFLVNVMQFHTALTEAYTFNDTSVWTWKGIQESYGDGGQLLYGGVVGNMISMASISFLGKYGTSILIFVSGVTALLLGTRISLLDLWDKQKQLAEKAAVAASEKASQIELSIPEIPKAKKKPSSLKQAKKQMKNVRRAAKPVAKPVLDHIQAENSLVRAGLSTKVKDLRGFDSDTLLADKPLPVDQTLPAFIDPLVSTEVTTAVEEAPVEPVGNPDPEVQVPVDTGIAFTDFEEDAGFAQQQQEEVVLAALQGLSESEPSPGPDSPMTNPGDSEVDGKGEGSKSDHASPDQTASSGQVSGDQKKLKNSDIDPLTKNAVEQKIEQLVQEEYKHYKLPPITLLNKTENKRSGQERQAVMEKARKLEETLSHFGVEAKVVQISRGPTITMFELQPSPGVKVSKITNLSDDIALSLAAHTVRIVAPIPGKSAVGVEVPNETKSMVGLREALESKQFKEAKSKLTFILGKDISGNPITADLGKMPHMLVAGATGSGKSVCVNTIISSILFNAKPDEVKFLMVDPKMVELSTYNGIPHLILPVVIDPKKAAIALNWAVQEMERRYLLFTEVGVKDADSYNRKRDQFNESKAPEEPPMEKMPKIVVIVDELADLMMVAPDQVEDAICRLAQKARAAGIHLIVATQRPSVDVITGVIKANIPSRIAFSVSSQTDSRTILDSAGAEKLLGQGDMLFFPTGASKPKRIQGAYVSDEEVEGLVETIKAQVDEITYNEEILTAPALSQESEDTDELLAEAIEFVVQTKKASASMLQRKFRVGYNRAARMVDEMEIRGIVGPTRGSKPREVIMTAEELEALESGETGA